MKKNLAGFVAAVLPSLMLVLPGSLSARGRHGAAVVITLKDGQSVSGELIAVKPDSLLLFVGKDETVDLAGISSVRIVRRSRALLGAVCGFVAGVAGTAIYASAQEEVEDPWTGFWQGMSVIGAGLLFIGSGTGLGIGAGLLAGKDKTIWLEGRSEPEVARALAYLRRRARIRDLE